MLSTLDAIRQRRSVRGFLPQPVPEPTLRAVFELAQRAPSNCNTQPWQVHVVQGDSALRLSQRLSSAALDPAQHAPDFPYDGRYEGEYRERQGDAAARLFGASAIARDDRAGRMRSFLRNYEFFGAPQAAFIFLPAAFGLREAADCGIYAQTLMLALTAHGLASCPQTALSLHAPLVREHLGLGPELKLLMGLSFGFEDPADPANACRIERAALPRAVTFHA
jgi:hypothetical protein